MIITLFRVWLIDLLKLDSQKVDRYSRLKSSPFIRITPVFLDQVLIVIDQY